MTGRSKASVVVIVAVALAIALTSIAMGGVIPGGPSTNGPTPIAGIATYADIVKSLYSIEKTSKGLVDVFTLTEADVHTKTKSEAGRELYVAKIGTGPTKIWVSANIHGNEQLTSEAVLQALKYLSSSNAADARLIRQKLEIHFIPTMNPDGREMNIRQTALFDDAGNAIMVTNPNTGEVSQKLVDLNRDWYPGMEADESIAWYAYFCDLKPDYLLDLHHQGFKTVPYTNESTSMSMGISLSPDDNRHNINDDYRDPVRQLASYVYDKISGYGYTHIDRYQLINTPSPGIITELDYKGGMSSAVMVDNTFLNYGNLNADNHSCPAIFFETKGNTSDGSLGQKASGYLTKQNTQAIMAYLYGLASGEALKGDPYHWYDIPAWSPVTYYYVYGINPPFELADAWIGPAAADSTVAFDFMW